MGKFGMSSEQLEESVRTITNPDTYKKERVTVASPETVIKADEMAALDRAFGFLEKMQNQRHQIKTQVEDLIPEMA